MPQLPCPAPERRKKTGTSSGYGLGDTQAQAEARARTDAETEADRDARRSLQMFSCRPPCNRGDRVEKDAPVVDEPAFLDGATWRASMKCAWRLFVQCKLPAGGGGGGGGDLFKRKKRRKR